MSKQEFLEQLRRGLPGLPREDIEERLKFYSEMLEDRMEEGLSEEEAKQRKSAVFMEKLQLRATQQIERFLLGWYNINTLKLARCKLHLTRPN